LVVIGEEAQKAYILMHPLRFRIVKLLMGDEDGKMYVNEIARELGDGNVEKYRRLVSHHLLVLDQYGLVNSEYGPRGGPSTDASGRPVYVNYFALTPEAVEVLEKINL